LAGQWDTVFFLELMRLYMTYFIQTDSYVARRFL
jgi:hypothetical protein